MERHTYFSRYLDNPIGREAYSLQYQHDLERIGRWIGVDLSESIGIDPSEIFRIRNEGLSIVKWMGQQGFKTREEIALLESISLSALVLTQNDHQAIRVASLERKLQPVQESFNKLVERLTTDFPIDVAQGKIERFYAAMKPLVDELESERLKIPPAGSVIPIMESGVLYKFPVYTTESQRADDTTWPEQAIIAEETLHLASALEMQLPINIPEISGNEAHNLEELCIKYFVNKALYGIRASEDVISQFAFSREKQLDVWRLIASEIGETSLEEFFFDGTATVDRYNTIAIAINNAVETM